MSKPKLLVQQPTGKQEIVEVGDGRYHWDGIIFWDERSQGQAPQNFVDAIGGLEFVGGVLSINSTKKVDADKKKTDDAAAAAGVAADKAVIGDSSKANDIEDIKVILEAVKKELLRLESLIK